MSSLISILQMSLSFDKSSNETTLWTFYDTCY